MELFTLTDIALIGLAWSAYAIAGVYFFAWKPKQRAVQLTRRKSVPPISFDGSTAD